MTNWPEVITDEQLAKHADIPDAEMRQDIRDTESEIHELEALEKAEREASTASVVPEHERRLAAFRASARGYQVKERQGFIAYLRRVLAARAAKVSPPNLPSSVNRLLEEPRL